MSRTVESLAAPPATPSFEVERLEPVDGRLVVSGRWYGIRGRRFVRPTLTLVADGTNLRLLASLEDKPWAAQDGEPWQASFPWKLGDAEIIDAELSVANDLVVALTPGRGDAPPAEERRAARSRESQLALLRRELRILSDELAEERQRAESLREELERAEQASVEAAAAIARRDAALSKLDEVESERDEVAAERDEAAAERDRAGAELEQTERARAEAEAARTDAEREHGRLGKLLGRARRERDDAIAKAEAFARERERLRSERDEASQRHAFPTPALPATSGARLPGPHRGHQLALGHASWATRTAALATLFAFVFALALIVHVV
jgi:hypothetical protein